MIGHSRNKRTKKSSGTKIQMILVGWGAGHVRFAGVEA